MTNTDSEEIDPPQAPTCDLLQRLARDLERAEFVDGVAGLQGEWGHEKDPTGALDAYMRARLADEYLTPIPDIDLATAQDLARRATMDFIAQAGRRRSGGLRRIVDAWARDMRASRDLAAIRTKPAREYVKRNGSKSRPVVNGLVRTGRTVLIDGVRVPVVERVS